MIRGYGLKVQWSKEDDAYVATSPEFPSLSGVNADPEKAIAELREALEMAIEICEEDGVLLPARQAMEEHSGQFRVRLPRSLHRRAVERAEYEGVSLNTLVVSCLSSELGCGEAERRSKRELLQAIASAALWASPPEVAEARSVTSGESLAVWDSLPAKAYNSKSLS